MTDKEESKHKDSTHEGKAICYFCLATRKFERTPEPYLLKALENIEDIQKKSPAILILQSQCHLSLQNHEAACCSFKAAEQAVKNLADLNPKSRRHWQVALRRLKLKLCATSCSSQEGVFSLH